MCRQELQRFENSSGIQVGVAYGGQDGGANKYDQGARLYSGCEIVVATPGRLIDFYEVRAYLLVVISNSSIPFCHEHHTTVFMHFFKKNAHHFPGKHFSLHIIFH